MTSSQSANSTNGFGIVGVGAAACAACCAVPLFGLLMALVAGASVLALALGGIVLAAAIAAVGSAFIGWRRRRARAQLAPLAPAPVAMPTRSGR